ncbi:hypothetical protein B0H13DRAFT_1850949 [Mycena leptocephala]|nr:hypothetical protein B0H13DRAFT_1850949 [Mycena leptocephala]
MLDSIWKFFFPKKSVEHPPLQRPLRYLRSTDLHPAVQQQNLHRNEGPLDSPNVPAPDYPGLFQNAAQFYPGPPGSHHMSLPNQPNPHQGYYGGFGAHPFGGSPQFLAQNQWPHHFNPPPNPHPGQYVPPPAFAPPGYPPPGHNIPPSVPFVALPFGPESSRTTLHNPLKAEAASIAASLARDHSELSTLDWPTGSVRRETIKGLEERKWKHNKWAWRSNGTVQHQRYMAEVRACLGVLRCASCGRLTRPKTQPGARKNQISTGCTSRTCSIDAPLLHDQCEARTFHYKFDRAGETVLIWERSGNHSTHDKPPSEEDQVDSQVMRKQDAGAHKLRTGDPGPGSVPLAGISATLAAPGAARYQLGQSQARLGINTGSS